MAMTVRLPDELDAQLEAIARARHMSKHAVIIEAATRFANDTSRSALVDSAVDFVLDNDKALLERLEDA
ncbi:MULTISPECIES: ribbon-helix-helix protein, CopG family [unclassified Microbacterium]|uniref:ribbon-helix-helix protein, CopG family n=1 Tax=unclassified Microbacterium TaxID=2609290 RepID=UPI00109CCB2D|nr:MULTISPECIES: ribbon-helix-helix protein, CopG family [unclassified Microbacterium]